MKLKVFNLTSPLVEIVVPGIGTIAPRDAAQYFPYSGENEIGELGFSPHAILDAEVASGRISYARIAESDDHGQIGCVSVRVLPFSADNPEQSGNLITSPDVIPTGALFLGCVVHRSVAAGDAFTVDVGFSGTTNTLGNDVDLDGTGDVPTSAYFGAKTIGGKQLLVTVNAGAVYGSVEAEVKLFYLVP
jgi:hypothetical protein